MELIESFSDGWINARFVESFVSAGDGSWRLFGRGGRCLGSTYMGPGEIAGTVVPAAPGFVGLLYRLQIDGSGFVEALPVVAWRIVAGVAIPIVCDEYDPQRAIEMPNGLVSLPLVADFDDRAAWRDYARAQATADPQTSGGASEKS